MTWPLVGVESAARLAVNDRWHSGRLVARSDCSGARCASTEWLSVDTMRLGMALQLDATDRTKMPAVFEQPKQQAIGFWSFALGVDGLYNSHGGCRW